MSAKFNYKIFDKKSKKYFTANRKSTWLQKGAVIDFIKRKTDKSVRMSSWEQVYNVDDLEVHIFPIENAIVKSASEFISDNKEELAVKEAKKREKELKREAAHKEYEIERLQKQLADTEAKLKNLKK